jgi:O-antigen/teichoic acid export membrane protein
MSTVSRKIATYHNLVFQYLMMAAMIVRGIIIPPLAARFIDHDLLGAWLASGNIVQWIMVSEGGAWLYLRQRAALEYGRNRHSDLAAVIGSGGIFLFLLGITIAIIGFILAPMIPVWMHVDPKFSSDMALAFSMTVLGYGIGLYAAIPRAVAHGIQKQFVANTNLLIAEICSISASIILLFYGYGILALGVGPLVREGVHNILNWPLFIYMMSKLKIKPLFSWDYFKSTSGQIGWTFLNNLSNVLRNSVDALIVSQVFGNSYVLIVEWTKRAWDIFYTLISRATGSFTPALAHLYGEGDLKKFRDISNMLFSAMAVGLGVTLGFGQAFNQEFVGLWVGSQFYAGDAYNLVLGFAIAASAVSFTLLEVMFATGNIRGPAIVQLLRSLIRIALLFILIPFLGILSIPASILVTEVCVGIVYLTYQWKITLNMTRKSILINQLSIVRAALAGVVLAGLWSVLPGANTWKELITQGAIFGSCLLVMIYLIEPFVRTKVNQIVLPNKNA